MKALAASLRCLVTLLALFVLGVRPSAAQEQETYRIGPEDVLSITFWQQPDLNQLVRVRTDGIVALPVIGETKVAGLTPEEAAERIVSRISRYNRNVSQALVQVTEFNSRRVFVTGNVGKAGPLTYETVPDLWTVIRDAGGPTETADLSRVAVVLPSGNTVVVNLSSILAAGKADTLKPLQPGTSVDVPAEVAPTTTYRRESFDSRDAIVYVTGHVVTPGAVSVKDHMSVYDAIALAGGPAPTADLKKVSVMSKGLEHPVTYSLDLRPESRTRESMDYQVQYEDLIIVGEKGAGFGATIGTVAAIAAIVTSVIVVVDYFDRRSLERAAAAAAASP